jgi:hypothetical protein
LKIRRGREKNNKPEASTGSGADLSNRKQEPHKTYSAGSWKIERNI